MDNHLKKIDGHRWEVQKEYNPKMRVPGIIYSDEMMIKQVIKDKSYNQIANAATLPGVVKAALAMPDIHYGYGLPIGGVMAMDLDCGVISPGAVGYDINCGVRLIRSNLTLKDIQTKKTDLIHALYANIPVGIGSKGRRRLTENEQEKILQNGVKWAVNSGYGCDEDMQFIESSGVLSGADPGLISKEAKERGRGQQGTLGSGNHFVEIQVVDKIYDFDTAARFGLTIGHIAVMIHTGSRGFGHQVCTDYLAVMKKAAKKYGIHVVDAHFACVPINSTEGQGYLSAMSACANYAWVNRQIIMADVIDCFLKVLPIGPKDLDMHLVYDVAHNIIKIEEHEVSGKKRKLAVYRKGATRSFPAGHRELPELYRDVGQPVIIPGDMGTNSYVLVGLNKSMEETFGSSCHGAGRVMSRHAAVKAARNRRIDRELNEKGILVCAPNMRSIKEEMPDAYKDISRVVNVMHNAGLSKKVVRLKPLAVIKG